MATPVSGDFVPVEDPKEAKSYLKEANKTGASVTIWTQDQKNLIKTKISAVIESDDSLYIRTPEGKDPKEMAAQAIDYFFSLSLSRASIFFKTKMSGYDTAGIKFDLPEKVFKVQRRKDFRFSIPDGHILKITLQDPLSGAPSATKKALDISAGGLSFLVNKSEEVIYSKGIILKNIQFKIKDKNICVDGEIRHTQEMQPDSRHKGVKVGVQFVQPKESDTQIIASFVLEETRKYLSKVI